MTRAQAVELANGVFAAARDALTVGDRQAFCAALGQFTDAGRPDVEGKVWNVLLDALDGTRDLAATLLTNSTTPTRPATSAIPSPTQLASRLDKARS